MATVLYTRVNLDTLIFAMEQRPESAARRSAWEWLSEQDCFTFEGAALLVPSATWDRTTYAATPTHCTCPAHNKGRWCWHKEAACIVTSARDEDEMFDLLNDYGSEAEAQREWQRRTITQRTMQRDAAQRAAAYAGVGELFAS